MISRHQHLCPVRTLQTAAVRFLLFGTIEYLLTSGRSNFKSEPQKRAGNRGSRTQTVSRGECLNSGSSNLGG
jgi:hypothetical protein